MREVVATVTVEAKDSVLGNGGCVEEVEGGCMEEVEGSAEESFTHA